MSPIDDYQWSVRFLKRVFRVCGQDILSNGYRRDILMYTITMFWIIKTTFDLVTFLDTEHYNATVRYTAALFGFGALKVSSEHLTHIDQQQHLSNPSLAPPDPHQILYPSPSASQPLIFYFLLSLATFNWCRPSCAVKWRS